MKIKFLGAAGTVTGSSYALTSGSGQSILIDLGMFQGLPEIDKMNYEQFDYDCGHLSGAVLTHAHLDHCGRLPILLPHGFRDSIWMTPATADLTQLSLMDSAKINREDPSKSLYDKELAIKTIDRFKTVEYRTPFQLADFKITLRDAGHLLGSAILEIEDMRPDSNIRKIVFSGDLGNTPEDLLMETEIIDSADAVVMESTYGDKLHSKNDPATILQTEVNTVENTGGVLLIPTFALERTQEILHILMHLKKEGNIKIETPVYLDSPMGEKATLIYMEHKALFNAHIQHDLDIESIFGFPGLEVLAKREDSKRVYRQPGPKVIIAGSGMMTGGRILAHAAYYLPRKSTRLLIVGYQGDGTLGREIVEGSTLVSIDKLPVHINASVNSTDSMSSHADQQQLMNWLKPIKNVKKVFLTHGDNEPRTVLSKRISGELGIADVILPMMRQEITF